MQMTTNMANDYYDCKSGLDTDSRLGPLRVTAKGLLSPQDIKRAFTATSILSFCIGLILVNWGGPLILGLGVVSLLAALMYTGGPWPLSYYALGELMAFVFFGPIAVWGSFYLQSRSMSLTPIVLGVLPGLYSVALMGLNNLRDRETDLEGNKMTLANLVPRKVFLIFLGLVISSLVFFPLFLGFHLSLPEIALSSLIPLLFFKTWKGILGDSQELNQYLPRIGQCLFMHTLFISLCLIQSTH
jgi:1,4-dihydroxy-2-naphthoate polyprenyltransferase